MVERWRNDDDTRINFGDGFTLVLEWGFKVSRLSFRYGKTFFPFVLNLEKVKASLGEGA